MKIIISSGHGKYIRGASGYLDEVDEARKVVEEVAKNLRQLGVEVDTFHDDESETQDDNLEAIVDYHNAQTRDIDVSVHFNAYETTSKPMGTEVLYTTQSDLAGAVCEAIVEAGGFVDRGAKYRSDLYFLNNTEQPAILIETCFVDSTADADAYRASFDDITDAIAAALSGGVEDVVSVPEPSLPIEFSGNNRVDIMGAAEGDVTVIVNGKTLRTAEHGLTAVVMLIRVTGDAAVTINGEDLHRAPNIPDNQCDIIATVFGGEDDYNVSAYDEDHVLDDEDMYVALPDRFEGDRPTVRVYNRAKGVSALAAIEDVGPWNTDDPYWSKGTRPQAESGTDMSGRETNGAGIDLSPAMADALGIEGKGKVDWEFVTE
jgi:N-acetylmuramoyl-L-alanine amidase